MGRLALVIMACVMTGCAPHQGQVGDSSAQDGWEPLLVPGSFDGWTRMPGGEWTWDENVLVGTNVKSEPLHGLLLSEEVFSDFKLRLWFRITEGCSGLYFRVARNENRTGVNGFQAEIDPNMETGGLYETGGRAWVVKPDPLRLEEVYTPGKWARMEIEAIGADVEVRVNGMVTASLSDDPGRRTGHLAIQLHGGQDVHVEVRGLEIHHLP